jgi:hypothetical protein
MLMRPSSARRGPFGPGLLLVSAALALPRATSAGEPPVAVGEVRGKTAAGEFSEPLRSALHAAIAGVPLERSRQHFVLSAKLLRLDAERVGNGARATASVSLTLRRAREQSLHAVLTGHATAEETDATVSETREDALCAAVNSALRRLPEAVQ